MLSIFFFFFLNFKPLILNFFFLSFNEYIYLSIGNIFFKKFFYKNIHVVIFTLIFFLNLTYFFFDQQHKNILSNFKNIFIKDIYTAGINNFFLESGISNILIFNDVSIFYKNIIFFKNLSLEVSSSGNFFFFTKFKLFSFNFTFNFFFNFFHT